MRWNPNFSQPLGRLVLYTVSKSKHERSVMSLVHAFEETLVNICFKTRMSTRKGSSSIFALFLSIQ